MVYTVILPVYSCFKWSV